jgi:integrase
MDAEARRQMIAAAPERERGRRRRPRLDRQEAAAVRDTSLNGDWRPPVKEVKIEVAPDERLSPHSLRSTYTSHLIVGLGLDAATTERNAAVLKRAAERGFGS